MPNQMFHRTNLQFGIETVTVAIGLAGMIADAPADNRQWVLFCEQFERLGYLPLLHQVKVATNIFTGGTIEIARWKFAPMSRRAGTPRTGLVP